MNLLSFSPPWGEHVSPRWKWKLICGSFLVFLVIRNRIPPPALSVSAKALWADLFSGFFRQPVWKARQKVQLRRHSGHRGKANSFSRKRSDKTNCERPYHVHAQFDKCKKQGCENLSSQITLTFCDPQISNLFLANESFHTVWFEVKDTPKSQASSLRGQRPILGRARRPKPNSEGDKKRSMRHTKWHTKDSKLDKLNTTTCH